MANKGKSEDDRFDAEDHLLLANVLAGGAQMSDQQFLELMARSDENLYGDPDTDGLCHKISLEAQVARELLAAGEYEDVRSKWSKESWRRWLDSKFFKRYQEARAAGRDPEKDFEERGWSV